MFHSGTPASSSYINVLVFRFVRAPADRRPRLGDHGWRVLIRRMRTNQPDWTDDPPLKAPKEAKYAQRRFSTAPLAGARVSDLTLRPSRSRIEVGSSTLRLTVPGSLTSTMPPAKSRRRTPLHRLRAPRALPRSMSYPDHQCAGVIPAELTASLPAEIRK